MSKEPQTSDWRERLDVLPRTGASSRGRIGWTPGRAITSIATNAAVEFIATLLREQIEAVLLCVVMGAGREGGGSQLCRADRYLAPGALLAQTLASAIR